MTTLRFFASSEQSSAVDATGYKGFYYHFLHMASGKRAWNSELSSIDTALFIAGALAAEAYFDGPSSDEAEIRSLATLLYERIEWDWMLQGGTTICHGWRPEPDAGFIPYRWEGYDEALVLYILALGSPTHGIGSECYDAWCSSYEWKLVYDIEYLYAGPLFIHQLSHVWIDFRGIQDRYMRDKGIDYFENSRRATQVQQQYGMRNPLGISDVGDLCRGNHSERRAWADDGKNRRRGTGVLRLRRKRRSIRAGRRQPLAPWAVAAALPFAPDIVLPTVMNFRRLKVEVANPYGFKASFNQLFQGKDGDGLGWISKYHFGINEGPTVLMIENYRSGLIWTLTRRSAPFVNGLRAAGFDGGWLQV